jgi:F-type H+-transporting ATPase subunit b
MELVNPGLGLIFWMTLAFGVVIFVLKKFAWPAITNALAEREESIEEALRLAETTREEMKKMKLDNEELLKEAKEERVAIINEARKIRDKMLEDARQRGNEEADRIVESAKERILNERNAAIVDIKNEIADISIQIAEKILREKMTDVKSQKSYIEKLLHEANPN